MDIYISLVDSPWGENPVDLAKVKLTIDQKTWLGQIMANHKRALSFLMNRYKLRRSALWKYRRSIKDNIKLFPGAGRPKCIDFESTSK
jgi:hypothetical protein